ncbi:hypothetical protein O0I10_003413 [Lichtheimia ornata]|uniref:Cytochrome p450 n=1 Tax=Lichtheimia ornata TaxID=688661 RepID=A0AAD7XZY6_9FUNG|nr:uncharacterized protein O0I10_003413 [Lichtheimia ornata]KAJ8660770.1 hypothetical protein O0I10_003413 [Lichtheimia ornata]
MYKALLDNEIVSGVLSTLDNKDISAFLNDPSHAKTRSVALVSFCTVIAAYALSRSRSHSKNKDTPMVPYTFPLIGSSREYRKDPEAFIKKWSSELGDVYKVHLFGRIQTVVSGKHVYCLQKDFDFQQGMSKTFDIWLLLDAPLGGRFTLDMIRHATIKFTRTKMLDNTPCVVKQLIAAEHEMIGDAQTPSEIANLYPLMEHLLAIASATNFVGPGLTKDKDLLETYKHLAVDVGSELGDGNEFLEAFPWISRLRMWYLGKHGNSVDKHRKRLLRAIKPIIDERLAAAETGKENPQDFIQDIIEESEITSSDPDKYIIAVRWILVMIASAGHTTTENTTIILYRILQHPEVIDELLQEQRQVLEKHHGADVNDAEDLATLFTGEVIKDLVKLDSVCREAMRLRSFYIDLPHTYVGKSPLALTNTCTINPGEDVLLNMWLNHNRTSMQNDGLGDYDKFKPFRFVGIDRSSTKLGGDFLLFGLGTHACPGRWFAMHQTKTILSMLLRRYQITPQETIVFPVGNRSHIPTGKVTFQKRQ